MPGLVVQDGQHPLMINENSGAKLPKLNLTSPGQSDGEKLEVWPENKSNSSQPSVVDTAHAREETPGSNAATMSPSMLRAI